MMATFFDILTIIFTIVTLVLTVMMLSRHFRPLFSVDIARASCGPTKTPSPVAAALNGLKANPNFSVYINVPRCAGYLPAHSLPAAG